MQLWACRVAFQIIPSIVANPRPTLRWQYAAAAVLFGLTLLSATQLGLLANVSKLPKARQSVPCYLVVFPACLSASGDGYILLASCLRLKSGTRLLRVL